MSKTIGTAPGTEEETPIDETEFWDVVMHDVFGPRQGGAIIFIDAENARKGVGKTGLAVYLARLFSKAFGYDFKKEDQTLSGEEYLQRYRDHPGAEQPSVIILDEFVGAGSGDARRAMSHQNIDFSRAWSILRTKRVVTFVTMPSWGDADSRLQKLADYRLRCLENPIGYFKPYKVVVPFGTGKVHSKGLGWGKAPARRIGFPDMTAHDDEYYNALAEHKDKVIDSDTWDADDLVDDTSDGVSSDTDEIQKEAYIDVAQEMRDSGYTVREIAEYVPFSRNWVSEKTSG